MNRFFLFILFILLFSGPVSAQVKKFGELELPVRMTRTLGINGNIGWNSLTGFGIGMQYYVIPKVALDGGVGISSTGYKFSIRGRYIFLKKNFSPFAGTGFIYSTGSFDRAVTIEDVNTGHDITFKLLPSRFLQFVVGGDLVTNGGFFLMFDLGYAYLLNDNIVIVSGTPSQDMDRVMRIAYGSGIVFEVSIGYIFKNKGFRSRF
ncbi:MAG: hypothetical protein GXO86_15225 [Chlorobi bacterium]|nr:hypothetical protein [Chlorobiota bacterium]